VLHALPGVSERGLVVGCAEFDALVQVTFGVKKVCSILVHNPRHPASVT
jgi:hypothetical protein